MVLQNNQCVCASGYARDGDHNCTKIPPAPVSNLHACPIIYSKCNYTGDSLQLCNGTVDLETSGWEEKPIKSLYVPSNVKVTLWTHIDYEGSKESFTSSQICISSNKFHLTKQKPSKKHLKKKGTTKSSRLIMERFDD
jgi:hypothetical protein